MNKDTKRFKLKMYRYQKGLTQQEIANLLNVSIMVYNGIENGKRSGKIKLWVQIQNILEIDDATMWQLVKSYNVID